MRADRLIALLLLLQTKEGARGLAAQLAGFGSSITLVDPPDELCHELRRIAGELATQWIPAGVD